MDDFFALVLGGWLSVNIGTVCVCNCQLANTSTVVYV